MTNTQQLDPRSLFFDSHRLKLHYWDYGCDDKPPMVLVHGGLGHARRWGWGGGGPRGGHHAFWVGLPRHGDRQRGPGAGYFVAAHHLDPAPRRRRVRGE